MKKKIVALLGVFIIAASSISGCSSPEKPETPAAADAGEAKDESNAQETAGDNAEEEENSVGMANPWVDITEEEAKEIIPRLFQAPEGAEVRGWMKCESLGDAKKGISPLIQLSFNLDGMEYTARAQLGAAEDTDIAGNYVEWTDGPDDVTLANWGGGNMAGKVCRSISETGYVDQITWYDVEIGILYSLSVADKDLDGFDIQAVAEQMYSAENEPL